MVGEDLECDGKLLASVEQILLSAVLRYPPHPVSAAHLYWHPLSKNAPIIMTIDDGSGAINLVQLVTRERVVRTSFNLFWAVFRSVREMRKSIVKFFCAHYSLDQKHGVDNGGRLA